MASVTITNTVAKCFKNKATGRTMNWWKTSFNMPVPDIFENNSIYTKTEGMLDAQGAGTSFDLSGFQVGWEAFAGNSVVTVHGPFGGGEILISQNWQHPDGSTMFSNEEYAYLDPLANAASWSYAQVVSNQGVAEWEINQNGTYKLITIVTGAITGARTTNIIITGCPAMGQYEPGYVWVEGNDLRWVSANGHLHTMYGQEVSNPGGQGGYFWIEGEHLYWIGSNGRKYKPKYNIRQFASIFSNGATGEISGKQPGYFWMDSEFGYEHIGYIDQFGYKWLCNSGANPYFFGSEP